MTLVHISSVVLTKLAPNLIYLVFSQLRDKIECLLLLDTYTIVRQNNLIKS